MIFDPAASRISPGVIRTGVQFLVIGGILVVATLKRLKLSRQVLATPLSKARSAAIGPVRLVGRVTSADSVSGFFADAKGKLVICHILRPKFPYIGWKTVHFIGSWKKELRIEDDTGSVRLDPKEFRVYLKPTFEFKGRMTKELRKKCDAFTADFRIVSKVHKEGLGGLNKRVWIREYVIDSIAPIEVFGYAKTKEPTGELVLSNTQGTPFLFGTRGLQKPSYRNLISLYGGAALVAVGLALCIFSTANLYSKQLIIGWGAAGLVTLAWMLKRHKIL